MRTNGDRPPSLRPVPDTSSQLFVWPAMPNKHRFFPLSHSHMSMDGGPPARYLPPHRRQQKSHRANHNSDLKHDPVSEPLPSNVRATDEPMDSLAELFEFQLTVGSAKKLEEPELSGDSTNHILELTCFPPHFADVDITNIMAKLLPTASTQGKAISSNSEASYRIVWPDDTHVLVAFASDEIANAVLEKAASVAPIVVLPFKNAAEPSLIVWKVAPNMLAKPSLRPAKTVTVANRMIQGALGLRSPKSPALEFESARLLEQRKRNARRRSIDPH